MQRNENSNGQRHSAPARRQAGQRPSVRTAGGSHAVKRGGFGFMQLIIIAAIVLVVAVFAGVVIPKLFSAPDVDPASEPGAKAVVAAGAQGGEVVQSTQAATPDAAPVPASDTNLASRADTFAVDPNRTEWSYADNGRKVVYLTIDDGPSDKTQQVLDVLDKYNCKATFFVTGHDPDSYHMIKEAYDRGHTIGLHTMTHDYGQIYASTDAYFADLDEIGQVVKGQIGYVPCFIRFPGGSSNAMAPAGMMDALKTEVQNRGYQYYDWNISTGDGSDHTADELYGYAIEGNPPGNYDQNIVMLCHDAATKQTTVDALPRIIEYYQGMGYSFEAIDPTTWVCHHG